ncbi:NAD(P)/FAD-dependent oxidoreductase [Marinitenerispora sediminis]|uniref:NADH-quinone oxidoreductase subunit E n=1 Tax=Marinitenerispora sediminis TaxID=1931232 RepID=A0A368TBK9_9ACTN|nr:NAD(P)/FAD-dependent oxidoreductase [Marinitenerispora sediminis]RCV52624.1 NADH-quinone oxidoreductase subunit E [Marinitenerispora sediminis]RCV60339.1 NADH-quinone oxidoreductase subunit E [Marinitenerispora sediminis]RCV60592.1 NADH-quinone oxidoreductase subunit E [Marinitenerispora sediminis]
MSRPRIVVVGPGFAGLNAIRRLERRIPKGAAELVLVAPNDYMLYTPLLPQVSSGLLTPQSLAVSLHRLLRRTRIVPGSAIGVDTQARAVLIRKISDELTYEPYDRLLLAPGSLTRVFDIPGLTEYGFGNKNLAEAVVLRDHVLGQLELANASQDPVEREERSRFIVVGGGYTGVETAASLHRLTEEAADRYPDLASAIRWHLVDIAPRLLPELGPRLGEEALDLLRRRGIEVKLEVSVREVSENKVTLTDGRVLPCRTLIWTAGTSPSPLVSSLGAPTERGRLRVGADLAVPDAREVFAVGDAAAIPDLTKDAEEALCPPTAQYAIHEGRAAADNIINSILGRPLRPFSYTDKGLVVDLSGRDAVARPLGVDLAGLPAMLVTRGYHLATVPSGPARARVAANWAIRSLLGGEVSRLGFMHGKPSTFVDIEAGHYLDPEHVRAEAARLRERAERQRG